MRWFIATGCLCRRKCCSSSVRDYPLNRKQFKISCAYGTNFAAYRLLYALSRVNSKASNYARGPSLDVVAANYHSWHVVLCFVTIGFCVANNVIAPQTVITARLRRNKQATRFAPNTACCLSQIHEGTNEDQACNAQRTMTICMQCFVFVEIRAVQLYR